MSDTRITPAKRSKWNYTPDLPMKLAPYWDWPLRPLASAAYLLKSWNPLMQRFFILAMALLVWNFATPDLSGAATPGWWIAQIWLRNLVILLVIAGGLHILLWVLRSQGDDTRYDMRPMPQRARAYTFGHQLWDNMLWTLGPALLFLTFWECLMHMAYANGWARVISFDSNPVWFLMLIVLIPIWAGLHFYWLHRLLHVGKLYTHVHAWHHRNINTGPWSGLAMHPVESFFLGFDTMLFFLLPAHPVHVIFLVFHHLIGAPTSHAGFEQVKIGKRASLEIGDFFHQLHHRFFDCNYGTFETPWDKWFNTFHDGTDDGDALVRDRRRKIRSKD